MCTSSMTRVDLAHCADCSHRRWGEEFLPSIEFVTFRRDLIEELLAKEKVYDRETSTGKALRRVREPA